LPEAPIRLSAILAALLLLGAAGALTACGSGGSGQDLNKVLNQTFSGDKKVDSGKLKLEITADLKGVQQLSGPIKIRMGGPFEGLQEKIKDTGQLPRAQFSVLATAAGQTVQAGGVSTGTKLFVNFRGTNYVIPDTLFNQFKQRLARAQARGNSNEPSLASLGIHPRDWLRSPNDEGTEKIGGTDTVHISSDVDVPKLLADFDELLRKVNTGSLGLSAQQRRQLPQGLPASTRKQIADAVKRAKLDLFTGKSDKILRKLEVNLDFDVPQNLRQQASGLQSGKLDFSYEVSDLNKAQQIVQPTSARPLSELRRLLGGSTSGLGGATGSSGSSSLGNGSQSGTQGGTQTRRYLKCLQQAQSQAQASQCGSLLKK
jgi:hypothetical protein